MGSLVLRGAVADDLAGVTEIYNHYIRATPVTFDLKPFTPEERGGWLAGFGERGRHRLQVAEREGRLVGFARSHAFRAKAAYDSSVETTIYLAPEATGAGIGRRLYGSLFDALAGEDVHRALAGITLPNPASVALHRSFGFTPVGVFREVGFKLGRYWDVQWFEKALR